ncbi:50S ribosomal protein L21, chloroplastic-like [Zea mays]|uniref:50S ribosomal protein L21 chloroplastic n=2 Tax=Zea mays TaxID=4577 RepID=K7U9Z6_MAIZE|nr:50S ribosomal protein L21, chloroplastic-like [Zea mays]AQK59343.1 50S ribosomal protein L21 chloroplastic [Zea mays]|eukprot:NP_001147263.2 50S ribosomal protein L21 [Zea mays]
MAQYYRCPPLSSSMTSLPAAVMATATTLPLGLLPSKTLTLSPLPSARRSLSIAAVEPRRWLLRAAAEEAPEAVEVEFVEPDAEAEEEPAVPEPVEAQLAAAGAGKDADIFAVVMIGSRQYIVMPGRYIYTQRLKGANVNDQIILNKVLLVSTREKAYIGMPVVTNAAVHAVVEEQGRDDKVIVFKYKKKKKYQRKLGHRQPNTRLRITGISGYEEYPADPILDPAAA